MTVTSRESVAAVLGLLLAVASATKSPPKLASFITYGNDEEVAKCADVLSYLCGETKEDSDVVTGASRPRISATESTLAPPPGTSRPVIKLCRAIRKQKRS